jgi:hypothetical protein
MRIQGIEKINTPKIPTIRDLEQGDIFTFLKGDYENDIVMLIDGDYAVRLEDGYAFDVDDYLDIPIKKLNCCLVIEGE